MIPLASIQQIAKINFIAPTTVFRRLTKSLCFMLKQLRSGTTDPQTSTIGSDHHVKRVSEAASVDEM
jgi:hypothetical protein